MKRFTLSLLALSLVAVLLPQPSRACFDTYLFLQGGSMVYPYKMVAFDCNGEYAVPSLHGTAPSLFTGKFNAYYGLARGVSVQAALVSGPKEASLFKVDQWGLRAVYNLVSNYHGVYDMDMVLEHNTSMTTSSSGTFEFSMPSIWHVNHYTIVAHPVGAFGRSTKLGVRGHGGVFYGTANNSIVGFGAEYESAQSSSNLGERLVNGRAGTSFFYGAELGQNLYWQNELIKGWGPGSSAGDFGFSVTLKVLMPGGFHK